jgi:multidrug efflux pump subunit AcrA (membrane-fusion protein)
MLFHKLKVASALVAAVCVLGLAAGAIGLRGRSADAASTQPALDSKPATSDNEDLVNVPALRDGQLAFIGTPLQAGDKAPGNRTATVKIGEKTVSYKMLRKGDRVEAGQLLAQLNDRLARSDIDIAKARIKVAEADERASMAARDEVKVRYQRQVKLWQGSPSKEDMDAAHLTWIRYIEEALSKHEAVKQARAELKKAEVDLDLYQIRSPVGGVIRSIKKHSGEAVKQFDTVFELEPSSDH